MVECVQLLEGSHMAGILSMTLALLDLRSDRLMQVNEAWAFGNPDPWAYLEK